MSLIQGCVGPRTKDRLDLNGLPYPAIDFQNKEVSLDIPVSSIVVRSVYGYAFKNSQYIVEVAVYRSWDVTTKVIQGRGNPARPTKRIWDYKRTEPEVQTGVSMYHNIWDEETGRCHSIMQTVLTNLGSID